jgi:hypothetical protein
MALALGLQRYSGYITSVEQGASSILNILGVGTQFTGIGLFKLGNGH